VAELRRFAADDLLRTVRMVSAAAGSNDAEAALIARRLVDSNLAGHDSHGVVRLPRYVHDVHTGGVIPNRHATIALETEALVVVDGHNGFGQVIGGEAMAIGIERARRRGACVLALRHSAHLGRIADWAEMVAEQGLASFHFVNVTGFTANRVAPFGGTDARLATNPVAAAIPRPGGEHIILDMATSVVAEGKIAVAANRGVPVPDGWLIDQAGRPTRDPGVLYTDPPGALLPFGGHKGFGLALFCDLLAGALLGAGGAASNCERGVRVENNMLAMIIDPAAIGCRRAFEAEVERILAFVKASPPSQPDGTVLAPGEPERASRAERLARGIPLEAETWRQILSAARSVGLSPADLGEQVEA
jgi:uncharacterized oxidoreductase